MFTTKASRKQFEEKIIRRCKDSIAYSSSEDKAAYLAAVKVAVSAFFEYMEEPLKFQQHKINNQEIQLKRLYNILNPIAEYVIDRMKDV